MTEITSSKTSYSGSMLESSGSFTSIDSLEQLHRGETQVFFSKDDDHSKVPSGPEHRSGRLGLEELRMNKLYGREKEKERLIHCYEKSVNGDQSESREFLVITGESGSGKTALVNSTLVPRVGQDKGIFLTGKFRQPFCSLPTEQGDTLILAIESFAENVLCLQNATAVEAIKKQIRQVLLDQPSLMNVVPKLGKLAGFDSQADPFEEVIHAERVATGEDLLLCGLWKLFRSICCQGYPLVLFLDDLQWADSLSLQVMRLLLKDPQIHNFMILAACRGSEVSYTDELSAVFRELEDRSTRITEICMKNLEFHSVLEMVGDSFTANSEDLRLLAEFIIRHTDGNMLCMRHLLLALEEHEEMSLNMGEGLWSKIGIEEGSTARDLVSNRIRRRLDHDTKELLKTASCLGVELDSDVLSRLFPDTFDSSLRVAQEEHLITYRRGRWYFEHDQIQLACYSLIPRLERGLFHLMLGHALEKVLHQPQNNTYLFVILSQFKRGLGQSKCPVFKAHVSQLCLSAAHMTMKKSAFDAALDYLKLAMTLQSKQRWFEEYAFTLDLYNTAAEAAYSNAKRDLAEDFINEVMQNAKFLEDKIRASTIQVYIFGSRNQMERAIEKGIGLLQDLGERLPASPRIWHIGFAVMKVRRATSTFSDEEFLSFPALKDNAIESKLRLMNIVSIYAYIMGSPLALVASARVIEITLMHGLSAISAVALGQWATLLCNVLGQVEEGVRIAKLALKVLEKYPNPELHARTTTFVNGFALLWTDPLSSLLPGLFRAHQVAMHCGDVECGILAGCVYSRIAMHVSVPLPQLRNIMAPIVDQVRRHGLGIYSTFIQPMLQYVLNLIGHARDDPTILSSAMMDEYRTFALLKSTKNLGVYSSVKVIKLLLCYHFHRYREAMRISQELDTSKYCNTDTFASLALGDLYLYQGLSALSSKSPRIRLAKTKLNNLKKVVKFNERAMLSKRLLLEGEILAKSGNVHQAIELFDQAAQSAKIDNVMGEESLAHERAALALFDSGLIDRSRLYFEKAIVAYGRWGAKAKIDFLLKHMAKKQLKVSRKSLSRPVITMIVPDIGSTVAGVQVRK